MGSVEYQLRAPFAAYNGATDRIVSRDQSELWDVVDPTLSLWKGLRNLNDDELATRTKEFRASLVRGKTLDALLPQAFSVVCEAIRRVLAVDPFPVQILGAAVLHWGGVAEMATGEGKTLVASLAAYLNALTGRGAHVVTVNDYLAQRDRDLLDPVYQYLGLKTGVITHGMPRQERCKAYRCDVTYGSNKEFGFDYLRDHVPRSEEEALRDALIVGNVLPYLLHGSRTPSAQCIQRELHYAIVDEADSVLIDEARTPLVLSNQAEDREEPATFRLADAVGREMQPGSHFRVAERERQIWLTVNGKIYLQAQRPSGVSVDRWSNAVVQAVRARLFFSRDRDYIVRNGKAVIVDSFTGRALEGRAWQAGLHQAVETKEGLSSLSRNEAIVSITYQTYFRQFDKLSGMTGTAAGEARELERIYGLKVVPIPTNRPARRTRYPDLVFATAEEKLAAIVSEVVLSSQARRPVLVGTISVDNSERLSALLEEAGVPHRVLNARQDADEAEVVAHAGRLGAVTIATNMAGRGTDILLGGHLDLLARDLAAQDGAVALECSSTDYRAALLECQERQRYRVLGGVSLERYAAAVALLRPRLQREREQVLALGGLHVIGTERHEAHRIDQQLFGRAARQGDPGSSRFFVSLEDEVVRLFLPKTIRMGLRLCYRCGLGGVARMLTPLAVGWAQKRAERHHFKIRLALLKRNAEIRKWRQSERYDELKDRWKTQIV